MLLSVLYSSSVTTGTPPSAALRNTLDLDVMPTASVMRATGSPITSTCPRSQAPRPRSTIGQIAAVTERIRVGSGGVMLPTTCRPPSPSASRCWRPSTRAAFISASGARRYHQVTAFALRQRDVGQARDDFLERLQELIFWDRGGFPENHPFSRVEAMPSDTPLPPIWILGSSDYGARLAASMGVGYAFAHHFASFDAETAMRLYREGFNPEGIEERPHAILGVAAVCAETDEEAERLAASIDFFWLRREQGEYRPLSSPEEVLAHPYSEAERERIRRNRARLFVGSPATMKARLAPLIEATQADELMITSAIYDHEARKRSYELVMEAFG